MFGSKTIIRAPSWMESSITDADGHIRLDLIDKQIESSKEVISDFQGPGGTSSFGYEYDHGHRKCLSRYESLASELRTAIKNGKGDNIYIKWYEENW